MAPTAAVLMAVAIPTPAAVAADPIVAVDVVSAVVVDSRAAGTLSAVILAVGH
jgi:hypothetical protein